MGPRFAQGNITTQNLNPNSGVPTAASSVQLPLTQDYDTIAIQIVGTYTGALSLQGTVDGTNWITLGGGQALTNANTAVQSSNIASATQGLFQADVSGYQAVRVSALAAVTGTAVVSIVGTVSNGITGIDTPVLLGTGANSIGTVSTPSGNAINVNTAASTNASSQKASAGNLFEVSISNPTATAAVVKFYNKATAPTVGTDTPVLTIPVAAGALVQMAFGNIGKRFTTGIAMAVTALAADSDTGVAVAGVHVHGTYI